MPTPPFPWPRLTWRRRLLLLAAAQVLAFAGYASSLGGDFVFDDKPLLLGQSCHWGVERIPDMFTPGVHNGCSARPVRSATYALDHSLWGLDPFGYHLSNVLLHGLVVLALGILVWRLGCRPRVAMLAAALFALHPVGTEAVAYVSGRRDLLAALFSLLATTAYLSFRVKSLPTNSGPSRRDEAPRSQGASQVPVLNDTGLVAEHSERGWIGDASDAERIRREALKGGLPRLVAALTLLLAGIFSHESAAALPAVWVLLELCLAARKQPGAGMLTSARSLLTPRLAIPLGGIMALVLGIATWKVVAANISGRLELWGGSLPAHLANVLRMHALYLKQLLFPVELVADYSADAFPISTSLFEGRALLAAVLVLGAVVLALAAWRRAPLAATAALGYFIMLLPSSQIVLHHELVAEHRLYLSMAGFCALVGAGLDRLNSAHGRLVWGLPGVLLVSYLGLTNSRNLDWRNEETLWSRTVAQVPTCARALTNLGALRGRQGKLKEAQALLERAVAIRPAYCHANVNLGKVLIKRGGAGAERGLSLLRRATCLPPPQHHSALAFALVDLGRWAQAADAFREALALRPDAPETNLGMARVLKRLGRPGAQAYYRAALRARPGYAPALYDLGELLGKQCKVNEAQVLLKQLRAQVAPGGSRDRAAAALASEITARCGGGTR